MICLVLLCIVTPLWYWVIGILWSGLLCRDPSHKWLVPLFGAVLLGWVGEISLMASIDYRVTISVLLLLSAVIGIWRRPKTDGWKTCFLFYYFAYLIAIAAIAAAPFPVLGPWGGDWFENLMLGKSVYIGLYNAGLVGRTPFYAGAGAWLRLFLDGLQAFELHSAAICACMVLVFQYWREASGRTLFRACTILAFLLTCFFLHNAVTLWAKFMAAACIVASVIEMQKSGQSKNKRRYLIYSAFWFASACGIHQAAVIFIPILGWMFVSIHGAHRKTLAYYAFFLVIFGVLFVGTFEGWTIARFGLTTKVLYNPAVRYRSQGAGFLQTSLGAFAYSFFPGFHRWLDIWFKGHSLQGSRVLRPVSLASKSYSTLIQWVTFCAGTFAFAYLPFIGLVWHDLSKPWVFVRRLRKHSGLILVCLIVVVTNAVLNPYYAYHGMMQTGLVPLAFMGFYLLLCRLEDRAAIHMRRFTLFAVLVLCALPWFGLNILTTGFLRFGNHPAAQSFWGRLLKADGDAGLVLANGLVSLGLYTFPWFLAGSLIGAGAIGYVMSRGGLS